MIEVNTLTFSYSKREDRIFIVINHADIDNRLDFIVTRLKMIELLNGFDEILIKFCDGGTLFKHLYKNQEALVQENIHDKPKENPNWEKNYSKDDINFTKYKKSVILDALSYTIVNNTFTFKLQNNGKPLAQSTMNSEMFQKTLSSMMRIIPFVSWGISSNILD